MDISKPKKIIGFLLLFFYASAGIPFTHYGWLEYVYLMPKGQKFVAKLDTGSKTSAILATDIHICKKNNILWATFTIQKTKHAPVITLQKEVTHFIKIKLRKGTSKTIKTITRPVVSLSVCLGKKKKNITFSLSDRTGFHYPVLLGRNAIATFNGTVNPLRKFTRKKSCKVKLNN